MNVGNNFNQPCCNSVAGVETGNRRIRVEDACIIEINNRFFLIVLFEINGFDRVVVFKITRQQAINSGIRMCRVFDTLPTNVAGISLQLQCVFVVDGFAFIVLEVENVNDRLIVVRSPLCAIERHED